MYLRAEHTESDVAVLRQFIRDNPLGILTTGIPSTKYPFLQSTHIPWILDVNDESSHTEVCVLRGHLARQNPHSQAFIQHLTEKRTSYLEHEVMVLYTATANHYITPKFYKESKPSTQKVVPTWNYFAVQAYGRARIYYDPRAPETVDFLGKQIRDLSHHAETSIMRHTGSNGRPSEWTVEQAPEPYIKLLQKTIIGIEISVDRLEGRCKMTQEKGNGDREGVIEGLSGLGTETGQMVADIVRARGAQSNASSKT